MKKNISICLIILLFNAGLKAQSVPRPEYPLPQFERSNWLNLNGTWTYTFDFGNSGHNRKLQESKGFDNKITVPFCPESKLSGVVYKDFINHIWYQRDVTVPDEWNGKKIILHFGAVYYKSEIYIDGTFVGRHFGGTSSFGFDVSPYVKAGKTFNLVVYANSELRSGKQTGGKQCTNYYSAGCSYTRTTGIWQTVWLEALTPDGLKSARVVTDIDQKQVIIYPGFYKEDISNKLRVTILDGSKTVSQKIVTACNQSVCILPIAKMKTWSPESPFLYALTYEVLDSANKVIDKVSSYVGMRKIHIEKNRIYLNNKPYYQRLVLDQGYYPDGIWTAPADNDLKKDIELSQAAGFNGARLHQKVFEPRFHYWADKLGYLTWGESSSWGMDYNDPEAQRNFIAEWVEIIERDRNYPSIVTWTPFNEAWDTDNSLYTRFISDIYRITKGLDPTRPVNDASGGDHVITDIWSVHNYESDSLALKAVLTPKEDGSFFSNDHFRYAPYEGQPYLIDEFGGIGWIPADKKKNDENSWGYGGLLKSENDLYTRLKGEVDAILQCKNVWGYCYTQLTDVEQEQNGIYQYDRTPKFDMKKIKNIFWQNPEFK